MRYRIVEEDRNTETVTIDSQDTVVSLCLGTLNALTTDSGQFINWRYVRRLVPIEDDKPGLRQPNAGFAELQCPDVACVLPDRHEGKHWDGADAW